VSKDLSVWRGLLRAGCTWLHAQREEERKRKKRKYRERSQ
jgi:hypothetical protein